MTLLAAGLVGATGAVLAVAMVAVARRSARAQVRRREARTAPALRPAPGRSAPAGRVPTAPPPARIKDGRNRTPAAPPLVGAAQGAGSYRPVAEALGGETLQLGPVPAWKLPAKSGAVSPGRDAAAGRDGGRTRARGSLFGRSRGEYSSATGVTDGGTVQAVGRPGGPPAAPAPNEGHDARDAPSVVTNSRSSRSESPGNASRRHDPRTVPGRGSTGR